MAAFAIQLQLRKKKIFRHLFLACRTKHLAGLQRSAGHFPSKWLWTYGPTLWLSIDTHIRSKGYKVICFWVFLNKIPGMKIFRCVGDIISTVIISRVLFTSTHLLFDDAKLIFRLVCTPSGFNENSMIRRGRVHAQPYGERTAAWKWNWFWQVLSCFLPFAAC